MIFSLVSIIASVSCLIIYNSFGVVQQFEDKFLSGPLGLQIRSCIGIAIEVFIYYFLMVDLYKWGVFIIATSDQSRYDYEEILSRRKKYLTIGLFVALLAITVMFFTFSTALIIYRNKEDNAIGDLWRKRLKDTIGAFFCLILVTYIVTLTLLIIRLKQRVPEYYQEQKK